MLPGIKTDAASERVGQPALPPDVDKTMRKYVKTTFVPVCLLLLAGISGCNGHNQYQTGFSWIDRWITPSETIYPAEEEYFLPGAGPALPAAPPAEISSELLQVEPSGLPELPPGTLLN